MGKNNKNKGNNKTAAAGGDKTNIKASSVLETVAAAPLATPAKDVKVVPTKTIDVSEASTTTKFERVPSPEEARPEQEEVHIVTASPSVHEQELDNDFEGIVTASSEVPNLYDVSFRSNVSVTEITFEKSPTAASGAPHIVEDEHDDYLPGIASEDDPNVLNLSESVPLDEPAAVDRSDETNNYVTLDADDAAESDRHQHDPMFTRPHEHDAVAVSGTTAAVLPEGAGWVDTVAHFINHRLFAFTDAFDLTKSSDIADALLAKSGFEYVVRALLPLPLFLKECVIFLPRLHLVVAIFLLRVLYNLLCLYVHAHIFVFSVPLRFVEALVLMLVEAVVDFAVAAFQRLTGRH